MNKLFLFLFIATTINCSYQLHALLIDTETINEIIAMVATIHQASVSNNNEQTTSYEDTTINYESLNYVNLQEEK